LELSSQRKEELHQALLSAYRSLPEFERMLSFKLGSRLQEVIALGSLRQVAFNLIDWAETEGRLSELIVGAHAQNPGNPLLRRFHNDYFSLVSPQEPVVLESIVSAANQFQDIAHWRAKLQRIEGAICHIGTRESGLGTGFLVAPGIVLTNHHVIQKVREKEISPAAVMLCFGYKRGEDGISVAEGSIYALESDWLIDYSLRDEVDDEPPSSRNPAPGNLDYALLRVAGRPGEQVIDGTRRGYIPMPARPPELKPQMPLVVVQHPRLGDSGDFSKTHAPMQLAIDTQSIIELNGNATRLYHRTNTLPGSSGSPCFNLELELVALHQAGSKKRNRAIPIATLKAHLEKKGLGHALGDSLS